MDGAAYLDPVLCGSGDSTNGIADGSESAPDFSTFDVVKATQYGALDRVKYLVEVEGSDVNFHDKDGVTLLHWAAINDRGSIADFLLEKGCEVDAVGGELRSCPIHWAVRQGHLAMVVKLMKARADPTFKDSEGYNCLHLACQLGHTLIAGYVVAKGCPVNIADDKGMTPLMWACLRATLSNDPTRMLISLGASLHMKDMVHGNTPLHWAIVGKNHYAMTIISKKSTTKFTVQNSNGETPIDMFENLLKEQELTDHKLPRELVCRFAVEARKNGIKCELLSQTNPMARIQYNNSFTRLMLRITADKRVRDLLVKVLPLFFLWSTGMVFTFSISYFLKLGMLILIFTTASVIKDYCFDSNTSNEISFNIYFSTKLCMYVTWLACIAPYVGSIHTIFITAVSAILWYFVIMCCKSDPGIIRTTQEEKAAAIIQLTEFQTASGHVIYFDPQTFCSTCLVRRPIRSKHCSVCDKCVAKFDHHCPWIGNCVGVNNHLYFIGYLTMIAFSVAYYLFGTYITLIEGCGHKSADFGKVQMIIDSCVCQPWMAYLGVIGAFHLLWVVGLLVFQLHQILILAMTTNERMNLGRYKHFQRRDGHRFWVESPFNRGILHNLADFTRWRFKGLLKTNRIDWFRAFGDDIKTFDQCKVAFMRGDFNQESQPLLGV